MVSVVEKQNAPLMDTSLDGFTVGGAVNATDEDQESGESEEGHWFDCSEFTEETHCIREEECIWFDSEDGADIQDSPDESYTETDNMDSGDRPIYSGASISVAESALLILTLALRHNITGECLSDFLSVIALHCLTTNLIHSSIYRFRKYFSSLKTPLTIHKYCTKCEYLFKENEETDNCPVCMSNMIDSKNMSYFVEIPLIYQLQQFFKRKTFHQNLYYRFNRTKKHSDNIEDIYDGELYKSYLSGNGFLKNPNNISFMWYTDGVPLFKSSKISIWPMFLSINELPYTERTKQENMLFAGLWFGKSKPSMASFLKPFHDSLSSIQNQGVQVECPHCQGTITVKGLLLCGTCDLPAKAIMMNMAQFNGEYGCIKCKQAGSVVPIGKGHGRVFPFDASLIDGPKRNHDEFIANGEEAFASGTRVLGVKGPSWWANICADVINGTGIDYMHTVLLGLVRRLLTLWFDPKFSSESFSVSNLADIADKRLAAIKPPYFIKRLPTSIKEHSSHWKASECRSWLFFYSVPVLFGLLKKDIFEHYLLFVEAIYILNLQSLSQQELLHAEELLIKFCCLFSSLYGARHMSANLHQLLHLHDTVKQLGPLWVYSCFCFESMNGKLVKLFHGTQNPAIQIANAVSTLMKLPVLSEVIKKDSLTGVLYSKLSNSNYHYSFTETITEGLHIIGAKTLRNLEMNYYNALALSLGTAPGTCYVFHRIMIDSVVYQCLEYKVESRNSYTVQFRQTDCIFYGHVVLYVKCLSVCSCKRVNCTCKANYMAIIRKIKVDRECIFSSNENEQVKPLMHNVLSGHLTKDFVAVPVHNIVDLCAFIDFEDQKGKVFVALRPNKVEGD